MADQEKIKNARETVLAATREYYQAAYGEPAPYKPGDRIGYGGRVFDESEMLSLVNSALDFWLTAGPYAARMERDLAQYLGVRHCSLVNSGSSANLLAFTALTSSMLGEKRVRKGDEVITVACGFPTTIAPILQVGAVPVFVDIGIPSYNADPDAVEAAVTPRTRAVMLAHTLGNPFDLRRIKALCDRHGLWLIEDNCDALGTEYDMPDGVHKTGTIGHIGTSSFYPPHHMTTGEGGAVYTNDPLLHRVVESLRDWGRDCYCQSGRDNTCRNRFTRQYGQLPLGYDHKYVYSHLGYNLKMTDLQAAIGCEQIKKMPYFVERRRENHARLLEGLRKYERWLTLPVAQAHARPSWFGFLITVKPDAPFTRDQLVDTLETHNIQTRMLFASNLLRHPCFDELRGTDAYRVSGELTQTDRVVTDTFWIGVYPGMDAARVDAMIGCIEEFMRKHGL